MLIKIIDHTIESKCLMIITNHHAGAFVVKRVHNFWNFICCLSRARQMGISQPTCRRKKTNNDKNRRILRIVKNYHVYEDDVLTFELH